MKIHITLSETEMFDALRESIDMLLEGSGASVRDNSKVILHWKEGSHGRDFYVTAVAERIDK